MIKELRAQAHHTIYLFALAAAIVCLAFVGIADAQGRKFPFAAIGDTSYSKVKEQEFDRLMAALNKESVAFMVHVGDFEADPRLPTKSGQDHHALHRRELSEGSGDVPEIGESIHPHTGGQRLD